MNSEALCDQLRLESLRAGLNLLILVFGGLTFTVLWQTLSFHRDKLLGQLEKAAAWVDDYSKATAIYLQHLKVVAEAWPHLGSPEKQAADVGAFERGANAYAHHASVYRFLLPVLLIGPPPVAEAVRRFHNAGAEALTALNKVRPFEKPGVVDRLADADTKVRTFVKLGGTILTTMHRESRLFAILKRWLRLSPRVVDREVSESSQ